MGTIRVLLICVRAFKFHFTLCEHQTLDVRSISPLIEKQHGNSAQCLFDRHISGQDRTLFPKAAHKNMIGFAFVPVMSIQCATGQCMEPAGSIKISPSKRSSRQQKASLQQDIISADEEFARRLQSQENAKFHTGANRYCYRSFIHTCNPFLSK